ncbi:MAG: hypothetical protein DWB56_15690, partial [Candidatus Jettenia sp.]|uniref:hypothetical protein n=1 Tax=Candidatus Jettenia sp. AMX1 TaxID=2293637 RepID=UPI0025551E7E
PIYFIIQPPFQGLKSYHLHWWSQAFMIFNITKGIACSRLFNLLGRTLLFHITIARVLSEAIS